MSEAQRKTKCRLGLDEDREKRWPFGLGWNEAGTLEVILRKLVPE